MNTPLPLLHREDDPYDAELIQSVLATERTERNGIKEAQRHGEEYFRLLIENASDLITILDADGTIRYESPAVERVLGYNPQDLTHKNIFEFVHPDDTPQVRSAFAHALHTPGTTLSVECRFRHHDGSWRIFETIGKNLLDDPAVAGIVINSRDITERKAVERLKDELISVVSHELRTPLTSLRGFAELLLQRDFPPEKQREFVTIIHSEALRLTNLINDFLDLQRMESGRQIYTFASVDVAPLLREAVAVFTSEGGKHPLHLEALDTLPPVRADAERISQVLSNLLSNAVKFSPCGGEVTVGARQEGAEMVVSVTDQGVGIPPEAVPKLFNKFYRVDSVATRTIKGTGLGLALVKEIVEAHQGRVWVESVLGQGSTFFFTLPTAPPATQALSASDTVTGESPHILLVEDDQAYARLLCEHFARVGLSVTTTAYAEQALELARLSPPRLVLTDVYLAGRMDGWDLLIALKDDPILRSIPVMVISAGQEANVRGLALGGADYLLKPVSRQWLLQAIRQRLSSLSGKRVLVVDDDKVLRRQLVEALSAEEDIEVEEAANGPEALARIEQCTPDLLLLDLLMPEMDGFEVLRQLRAGKHAMNLAVLVVTGKDLLPSEKAYIKQRLASLVSKEEAGLDYFAQVIGQILAA